MITCKLSQVKKGEQFQLTNRKFAPLWTKGDLGPKKTVWIYKGKMFYGTTKRVPLDKTVYVFDETRLK